MHGGWAHPDFLAFTVPADACTCWCWSSRCVRKATVLGVLGFSLRTLFCLGSSLFCKCFGDAGIVTSIGELGPEILDEMLRCQRVNLVPVDDQVTVHIGSERHSVAGVPFLAGEGTKFGLGGLDLVYLFEVLVEDWLDLGDKLGGELLVVERGNLLREGVDLGGPNLFFSLGEDRPGVCETVLSPFDESLQLLCLGLGVGYLRTVTFGQGLGAVELSVKLCDECQCPGELVSG